MDSKQVVAELLKPIPADELEHHRLYLQRHIK